MHSRTVPHSTWISLIVTALLLAACNAAAAPVPAVTATAIPEWFGMEMTDVRTGETFTMNDFSGKVVLIQTIAQWCPNCLFQQAESRKMAEQLGNPEDLVLLTMDVDSNEDEASLKKYAEDFAFEWRFVVGPLEVQRAIGNLYSVEYLNPPLDPMLLIDRQGNAHQLPYGLKKMDQLQEIVSPYLAK
jgi:cytochrome oxidase Cu insertion factor (SCO1/SenC/PrrC family)